MDSKKLAFINEVNRERKYGNFTGEFLTDVYNYLTGIYEIEEIDEDELVYSYLSSSKNFSTLTAENLAQLLKMLMNAYVPN